jgi:RNA polymerase sigma factor (sigma-70 family)
MNAVLAEQNVFMEKIMRENGPMISSAIYKISRGEPYGDDILSEVYFAIFLTLRKLGVGWTPPKSFIFAVIRNKVNDFLRQKYKDKDGMEEVKKHLNDQASQKEEVVAKINCLTHSEFQVFRLLGLGMTNTELAQSLHVSPETIKSHIKKIHAKCGVRDRGKLTLMAYQACFRAFSGAPFQTLDNFYAESDCCDQPSERRMNHGKIPPGGATLNMSSCLSRLH